LSLAAIVRGYTTSMGDSGLFVPKPSTDEGCQRHGTPNMG